MTENILIKGGHIIDPVQKLDCTGNIYISNGQIVTVTNGEPLANFEPDTTIEATSRIVTPGFIDLHCHLREPGYEQKETIQTGSMAAAKGGYTTICCMPNTNPPLDNPAAIELVRHIAKRQARIRILPIACTTRLRQGKELTPMAELAAAGAVGFSDDGSPVDDCRLLLRAMEYLKPFDLPLIDHCEELSLSAGGQMNEGIVSTFMGLPGIPAIAEEIAVGRALSLPSILRYICISRMSLHRVALGLSGKLKNRAST
jgi:dihydroorotase